MTAALVADDAIGWLGGLSILLLAAGVFFFLAGSIGLLRFPDSASRLHALTKADNLGVGLIVAGLLPHAAWPFGTLKLIAVWVLLLLASAVVGQLIAGIAVGDEGREQ